MRLTRRQSFSTVTAGLVPFAGAAQAESAGRLSFVLVNDVYRIGPDIEGRGGFAKLARVLADERRRARAAGRRVVFVHAGDTLSPSLLSSFDEGAHMIALFNELGLDVFVPGNHEFDFGTTTYLKRMAEARFQVLAANLRDTAGRPLPGHRDRVDLNAGGARVTIIGGAYEGTAGISHPDGVGWQPTVARVKAEAAAARERGADLVVAVIHADRADGVTLLESGAVDLILSGHNHDLFVRPRGPALLVESAYDAQFVTAVDVDVTPGARPAIAAPRIIDTAGVAPEPAMASRVSALEAGLARDLDTPLARLGTALDSHRALVRTRETAIGNLFADALKAETGADVALINGGSIRGDRTYAVGSSLSRRDVLTELPFHNRIVVTRVTGAALRAALEAGVSRIGQESGGFPQVAGLAADVDARAAAGHRITAVRIGTRVLDPAQTYRIVTNDFMARGGNGYGMLAGDVKITADSGNALVSQVVMSFLAKQTTVAPKVEGRVTVSGG